MNQPIDVVITWVDGNDQRLAELRRQYAQADELKNDDVGGVTRYASIGEIFWCLASINKFAPWVNHVYIVTDGQDPHVEPFLQRNFPEGYIPVTIVDHKEIFAGYDSFLPTFNSLSIETMLWRIPGLSRHFIEMNDDLLFCNPVQPEDFFAEEGVPVCYCFPDNIPFVKFTRILKRRKDGKQRLTFKANMIAAARVNGNWWSYLKMTHTMKPLVRDAFEECIGKRPDLMERNIRHRFRHAEQFNAEELHYLYLHDRHRLSCRSPKPILFYLQPKKREGYVARKLARLKAHPYKFCCFNGLNLAAPEDLRSIKNCIADILGITIE